MNVSIVCLTSDHSEGIRDLVTKSWYLCYYSYLRPRRCISKSSLTVSDFRRWELWVCILTLILGITMAPGLLHLQ
jgi:hypothetical protein